MGTPQARRKNYGEFAPALGRRLRDLEQVANLSLAFELPGRLEALGASRAGEYSMRLSPNQRLIFEIANAIIPVKEDGGVDSGCVDSIRILGVEDYH